ncbi:Hypothetical protein R9X50_00401100 [Acrodontium crateriforme]|uniref:Zn(2)-C6 fungal-type domain-containing protein n=1 Tax=Acrodontium crateriforme TaxID=150365 RepID=A0AAQ3M5B7_9PEZI|nr:Hypothetical protein R9X50_00401100 [Acrodontium crateriforme]
MAITTFAFPNVYVNDIMSRPQIGINRLPGNRRGSNEPKEVMNCKSCRKRKVIKCNRTKPTCEACQVFNCACVYDAVPKKRGPKTELLETLLKRVNGLEKRLQDKEAANLSDDETPIEVASATTATRDQAEEPGNSEGSAQPSLPAKNNITTYRPAAGPGSISLTDALIDTYFTRLHGKPFYILDETATRQRLQNGMLPQFLVHAIYAVSTRHVAHLCGGHNAAVTQSNTYASESRFEIDIDEPSIGHLQALLLLSMASFQLGRGRKSYMLLSHAISMAFALNLHCELPLELRITNNEREGRRKLFWTCYLMDRLTASGSKRPSLISDESVCLRLPAWTPHGTSAQLDGSYFPNGSSSTYASTGMSYTGQGSGTMFIEAVRILGMTNRYLALGGVKGDSHFPWHSQSTLSRIRSNLDEWATSTQDAFTTIDSLFGQPDSSTLVLSKLIYHLIHCLIYRPFLPIDLTELSGTGQHQSWQIEATNLCFLHANAIAELVDIGRNTSIVDWPSFVGYCICTAGTIHVHGINYVSSQEGDVFHDSSDLLAREMTQLADLRFIWAGIQHQWQVLQLVHAHHLQLVESLAANPMRFPPVFQMEDFFDRYAGSSIDGAFVTFSDIDPICLEGLISQSKTSQWAKNNNSGPLSSLSQHQTAVMRPAKKRRMTDEAHMRSASAENTDDSTIALDRRNTLATSIASIQQLTPETNDSLNANPDSNPDTAHFESQPPHPPTTSSSTLFTFHPIPNGNEFDSTNQNTWDPFYGAQSSFDYHPSPPPAGFNHSPTSSSPLGILEKDSFLGLLEHLAQNDLAEYGGPTDLDLFSKGDG